MILYTVKWVSGREEFADISESGDLSGKNIYVNMTNRCPCSCVFCLRQLKENVKDSPLWLKDGEPSVGEVLTEFGKYDLSVINELVFCGFGEPLERLDDICKVIDELRKTYPDLSIRVNTAGLANLIYGKDITPQLKDRFDTVSISLNAPTAEEYLELTRSKFCIESFDAMKEFAVLAKGQVPDVVMTVVDKVMSEEKIERCREICEELGVKLRVRPYEG